jgi:hypothetical protein
MSKKPYYTMIEAGGNRAMTFDNFIKVQAAYYGQNRLNNGTIPWTIIHGEYVVNPANGCIIGYAEDGVHGLIFSR